MRPEGADRRAGPLGRAADARLGRGRVLLAAAGGPAGDRIGRAAHQPARDRDRAFSQLAQVSSLTDDGGPALGCFASIEKRRGRAGGQTGSQILDPQRASARAVVGRRVFIRRAVEREHLAPAHRRGAREGRAAAAGRCWTRRPDFAATSSPGSATSWRPTTAPARAGGRSWIRSAPDVRQPRAAGAPASARSADRGEFGGFARGGAAAERVQAVREPVPLLLEHKRTMDAVRVRARGHGEHGGAPRPHPRARDDTPLGRDDGAVHRRTLVFFVVVAQLAAQRRVAEAAGSAARKNSVCCRPCSRASTTASRCRIGAAR